LPLLRLGQRLEVVLQKLQLIRGVMRQTATVFDGPALVRSPHHASGTRTLTATVGDATGTTAHTTLSVVVKN